MFRLRSPARLGRNEDGVTIVEFAFVAPVMILFITGMLELGYVAFARSTLESSVLSASRQSRVADCPNENAKEIKKFVQSRMSTIRSYNNEEVQLEVESYSGQFGDVGNPEPLDDLNGNAKYDPGEVYTDVNGNGKWDADMGKSGDYGSFGEVVRFTASYKVPSIIPFVANQVNDGKDFYEIASTTVVRNEPFKEATCAL